MKKLIGILLSILLCISLITMLSVYFSKNRLIETIPNITGVRSTYTNSIIPMLESLDSTFVSLNILALYDIGPDDRKSEHRNIERALSAYRTSLSYYKTPNPIDQIIPSLEKWRENTEKSVEMVKYFEALGVINPEELKRELVSFREKHETLEARAIELLYTGRMFDEGDDPTACKLGSWFISLNPNNPELAKTLNLAAERDRRFHQSIWRIKNLVRNGQIVEARAVLYSELRANKELIFNHLNEVNIMLVKEAEDRMERFRSHLSSVVKENRREAWKAFNQVVDANIQLADAKANSVLRLFKNLETVLIVIVFTLLCMFIWTNYDIIKKWATGWH
ncbi:MAG: hypothetical protein N2260_03190 [Syntrophobacterales bacterium]|nr:hypothetical protein [Syntrophobacterales bacterium]